MASVFQLMADTETFAVSLTRLGLIVVLFWIGGLKIAPYEADGIVPFVAESPFMSFLMDDPSDYKAHMNPEGKLVRKTAGGTWSTAPTRLRTSSARSSSAWAFCSASSPGCRRWRPWAACWFSACPWSRFPF